jgi:hypothetical protein
MRRNIWGVSFGGRVGYIKAWRTIPNRRDGPSVSNNLVFVDPCPRGANSANLISFFWVKTTLAHLRPVLTMAQEAEKVRVSEAIFPASASVVVAQKQLPHAYRAVSRAQRPSSCDQAISNAQGPLFYPFGHPLLISTPVPHN